MLAEELGADPAVARAGGLFHDIGKAVDHEVPGTHVEIGRRILQKFNVMNASSKRCRHTTKNIVRDSESMIVQVADAVSGGRPGARRDSVENYIKRLEISSFTDDSRIQRASRGLRIALTPAECRIETFQSLDVIFHGVAASTWATTRNGIGDLYDHALGSLVRIFFVVCLHRFDDAFINIELLQNATTDFHVSACTS